MESAQAFLDRGDARSKNSEGTRLIKNFFYSCFVPYTDNDGGDPTQPINLISLTGGRWNVPRQRMQEFYERLLPKLVDKQMVFALVEKPHPRGKLVVDVDSTSTVVDVGLLSETLAECTHIVYGDADDLWPSVYVSRSSAKPNHKVHFIVPSCVCTIADRVCMYLLVRQTLIQRGHSEQADCIDLKMTSLRMRYASKVDPQTKEWQLDKGFYTPFELAYPVLSQWSSPALFYFTALSFDDPCRELTSRGHSVHQEIRASVQTGPLSRLRLTSVMRLDYEQEDVNLTVEQKQQAVTWATSAPEMLPFLTELHYKVTNRWHGGILKLIRTKQGPCGADPTGLREHDHQHAYLIVSADLRQYALQCYCGEFEKRVLWRAADEELLGGTGANNDGEQNEDSEYDSDLEPARDPEVRMVEVAAVPKQPLPQPSAQQVSKQEERQRQKEFKAMQAIHKKQRLRERLKNTSPWDRLKELM